MGALTPTVLERVGRCATRVHVNGLVTGAEVVLFVDDSGSTSEFTHVATGGGHTFDVPELGTGAELTAIQDDGSGPTPPSPAVVVEDAAVPPTSAPLFPAEIGACSQCIRLTGLVPGCEVEVRQAGNVVGAGGADRHGTACIKVELRGDRQDPGPELTARMFVCGQPGPVGSIALVPDPVAPAPGLGGPLFGCQRTVPLHGLRRGAKTRIETDSGTYLGWICNCWTDVNVNVLHPLVPGERVRARQYWDNAACELDGPWSGWRDVVPPDDRIRPVVEEALVEGDRLIRVTNQIVGADLVVLVRDGPDAASDRFGPRPASDEPEIALNEPLAPAQQVAVEQHLCGRVETSDWVDVLPAPPTVIAPVVLPPLHACAGMVQVSGLQPGATVRIFQDGVPCGLGWAMLSSSIAVAAAPALVAGSMVTARQWVGGVAGPESDPVEVLPAPGELHEPRVVEPVAVGDTTVWVSGVTPGALVAVFSSGTLIGESFAGETLVSVPTSAPVDGVVHVEVRLCDRSRSSQRIEAIESPCAPRADVKLGESDLDYGSFHVAEHPRAEGGTDGGYDHPLRGRLYHPDVGAGPVAWLGRRPLVVIAHGLHRADQTDQSHLGYADLARHLVRWGMVVVSLDLAVVNCATEFGECSHLEDRPDVDPTQQWARGAIVLEAVGRLLEDPTIGQMLDHDRIGLVGHSMGGEGVVIAEVLNRSRVSPYGIRGVVSLAPTYWRPDDEVRIEDAKYLQLHGSHDRLLQSPGGVQGADPSYNGFRIHGKAYRPRSFVWVHGARHRGWNANWWNSTEAGHPPIPGPGELTLDEHTRIARCFVNAFFQDALLDRSEYEAYLHGLVLPDDVRSHDIYLQHHPPAAHVIDDFGDANDQLGFPEETPIDRTTSRVGGSSEAVGAGLDSWDDSEHVGVHDRSVHDTRSTDIAWLSPGTSYTTRFDAVALERSDVLSFRVAQHYDEDDSGEPVTTHNPVGIDMDLLVAVSDGSETATVRMGSAGTAPYPAPAPQPWAVFRTVRLPMDAFTAVNPDLDLGGIDRVTCRLQLHPTGRVLIDDLEFA